jgi:hypothetical protein
LIFKSITSRLFDSSLRELYYILYKKFNSQERLGNFDETHPCVFVLSTGRVGTKTLAKLLRLAKNIFSYHEPKPLLYGLSNLSYMQSIDPGSILDVLGQAFSTTREELLNYSLICNRGYVETSPQVTFLAPAIFKSIPNVRFIHLVRDPRAVVRSGMRRRWYDGHPADKTRIVPNTNTEIGKLWKNYSSFQKNLWLWNETNHWIMDFLSKLPDNRILQVRAEDVFSGRIDILNEIFSFISAPVPNKNKIQRVLGKQLNQQKTGSFPKPSDWTSEMHSDLRALAGKTANKLGYDFS